MSTAGRRRKSTFLTGQDAVAPSITDTTAPVAPAPAAWPRTPVVGGLAGLAVVLGGVQLDRKSVV